MPSLETIKDPAARSLLEKMLQRDDRNRISIAEALRKPMFRSADTSSVIRMNESIDIRPSFESIAIHKLNEAYMVIGMKIHAMGENFAASTSDPQQLQPIFLMEKEKPYCLSVRVTFPSMVSTFAKRVDRVILTFPEEQPCERIELSESVVEAALNTDTKLETCRRLTELQNRLFSPFDSEMNARANEHKTHRLNVTIRIGSSTEDGEKGFDVLKENLYVQCVLNPAEFLSPFTREVAEEWKCHPHDAQELETVDLTCGEIRLDLVPIWLS